MQLLFSIAVAGVLAGGWANIASAQIQLDNRRLKVDPSAPASKEYERLDQAAKPGRRSRARKGRADRTSIRLSGTMKEGERQVPEASGVAAEEKKTRGTVGASRSAGRRGRMRRRRSGKRRGTGIHGRARGSPMNVRPKSRDRSCPS